MSEMRRVRTGVPGLDDLVGGGIIEGNTVLVSGTTGTGKTILGLQFLYSGASAYNEPGVLATLETRPDELRSIAAQFGWDLCSIEKQGKLAIVDAASSRAGLPTSEKYALRRGFDVPTFIEEIYRAIEECKAKRLVIDSLSGLIRSGDPVELRSEMFRIGALMNQLKVTSLVLGETNGECQSRAGVEQFVSQGLITLCLTENNGCLERSLVVWKMRHTSHSMKRHHFEIGEHGIRVTTGDE
ncbi:MAG: AAA family ATPase [Candidatus Thorarchaeota archaeon]|nr:AAA family ATPase [Candidatus Thorarchaeota archaeon]